MLLFVVMRLRLLIGCFVKEFPYYLMNMIKAEYIDHMGSDLTVVNSARVSFDKESEWLPSGATTDYPGVVYQGHKVLAERDAKLITYLAKHDHFTPFTHPQITLRETVPIFVARQRFKHVVGFTYNETSRRYVDDSPEYYFPDGWRAKPEGPIKQGSGELLSPDTYVKSVYAHALQIADDTYRTLLAAGVAPEQARMVLPQSMLTNYYVTGSLAAFARLYKLRIDPHAQKEIQDLAVEIGKVIEPLFPVSWKALTQ